jgi:uroporphyrinogen decarboxylase
MTSRQLVIKTLEFKNSEGVIPRDLWTLPWAGNHYPEQLAKIQQDFPSDFGGISDPEYAAFPKTAGDPYETGEYTDEWGCIFKNVQQGVIGEVKNPIVAADDEDWNDTSRIRFPEELLSFDIEKVNTCCGKTDKFITAGCPRPFERLQFIRGSEQLYIDIILRPVKMLEFIEKMHDYYCRFITKWCLTNIDGIFFMDDWGSQRSLLINPLTWDELFRPMYQDYIDIAKKYGKKTIMHSDGYTLDIIPRLIDMGLDAINAQIFCIGVENLKQYAGKITFWGEIDRQHLLAQATTGEVKAAVRSVKQNLWKDGGCIAQMEFGAGAKPENIRAAYEAWDE